ncbi:HAMP domain-containing histidine kinase [Paenibacillus sp. N1-5-1-14]|uniref:sensor histidine kinase n=1 Tax=Paenibacillus radicibacter TaxID=2972488 RepID=UPI002158FF7A|nr:HAMP domain-containing sensor histidine kinase [Paenibacillus radicibacter]MCR8642897.1 HAMP domain-containing histidine kinase [Paenibacillus radicibacter]
MFTRLRNRFLILNMVIISCMLLVAFFAIYSFTYQNICRDIHKEMDNVSKFYDKPDSERKDKQHPYPMSTTYLQPGLSLSFELKTDSLWNITAIDSIFEMKDNFYDRAKNKVAFTPEHNGLFNLDGYKWFYAVQNLEPGYSIIYLDVTSQFTILSNLIITFIAVGLFMLIIIFFMSRFFANRYIAPVKEAFHKQKQFIADASHELKTPLTIIHTNTDLLLTSPEETIQSQAKWIHHIQSETERMKTLTNNLLYLTEMEDAQASISMSFAPFNISEVVESVILIMEAVIYEKNISLRYDIEPSITFQGNKEQIKQLCIILLDNAIKYTAPKGTITLQLNKRHTDILLTVSNTGEGIMSEHLDRIFDRFYRADPSRSRENGGYGLGLAIAKSIVDQHKGKIYAKSTLHAHTTFYVQLP